MTSIWLAIILQALFLGLAFVLRTLVHLRQTGSTGFRAFSRSRTGAERAGVLLLIAGGAMSIAGSLTAGPLPGIAPLEHGAVTIAGAAVALAALALIVWAQFAMGASWRIGVDPSEVTELVTAGPFSVVRNPIFSGMLLFWVGIALAVPNVLTLLAPLIAFAGIELQVRMVEEPYLLRTHGDAYRRYGARTGRLLPGLGTFRDR